MITSKGILRSVKVNMRNGLEKVIRPLIGASLFLSSCNFAQYALPTTLLDGFKKDREKPVQIIPLDTNHNGSPDVWYVQKKVKGEGYQTIKEMYDINHDGIIDMYRLKTGEPPYGWQYTPNGLYKHKYNGGE